MAKKFYSDVRFVRIEKLRGRAKAIAQEKGLTQGLAIIKTSINSLPEYDIEEVKGDPLLALETLGRQDGITPEKLSKALEKAFVEEKESG